MNWLASLFRRRKQEQELDAELRFHLEQQIEDNIASGMSPEEARRTATLSFGGVEQIKETCRDIRPSVWLEQLSKDIGFVTRSLFRAPGFTLTVLFTLIVGIGSATQVFRMTDKNILFGPPYPKSEQLFQIGFSDKTTPFAPVVPFAAQFEAYTAQHDIFTEFAGQKSVTDNVVINGEPSEPFFYDVSVDYFKTLGIQPALGRLFRPDEHQPGADNVVIISDRCWKSKFHGSPDVLGQTVLLGTKLCTVVGVLAAEQRFSDYFGGDIFHPLVTNTERNNINLMIMVVGRLKPGVSAAQALTMLSSIKLPSLPAYAQAQYQERKLVLKPLAELGQPALGRVSLAAGLFLYLLACVNVMNLMLVRLLNRRRELGIRLALGGTRWRLTRLVLLEGTGLTILVFMVVLWAAHLIFPQIVSAFFGFPPVCAPFWDLQTVACVGGLSLLANLIIVAAPVTRLAAVELNSVLKDGGVAVSESPRLRQLRSALVILQAVFAVILLAGSGLMLRTFEKIRQIDLGFDPIGRISIDLGFPQNYEAKPKLETRLQLFEQLREKLGSLPGIKAVSFGQRSLLNNSLWGNEMDMPDGSTPVVSPTYVDENLSAAAGLVLTRGRWFSAAHGSNEAVINESMAKVRFGSANPLGQFFKLRASQHIKSPEIYQVIGVIKDVREVMTSPAVLRYYVPIWRNPLSSTNLVLHIEPSAWQKESADQIRRMIYEVNPRLITYNVGSMTETIDWLLWSEHYTYTLLKGLSGIALCLVVIGLFSVVSYTVNSRMREFGVRLALGAEPKNLHRLVIKHGLTTTALGLIIGIAGALALTRFMQSLLYKTTPYDPWVYGGVALILLAATVIACWLPARRAAKADVAQLLRTE